MLSERKGDEHVQKEKVYLRGLSFLYICVCVITILCYIGNSNVNNNE